MDKFVIGVDAPEEETFFAYNHTEEVGGDFYIDYTMDEMKLILKEARDSAPGVEVKLYRLVSVDGV